MVAPDHHRSPLSSFVGGEWSGGNGSSVDVNPARPSEVVAEVSLAGRSEARAALEAAAAAAPEWSRMPAPSRGAILHRAADLLDARAETIGLDLAREEGKTLAEAIGETRRAAAIIRYFAGQTLDPDGETYPSSSPKTFLFARRIPLGVVTVITPWNFPIAIPAWKIAPALAFGNTVCWKPAEIVPLTAVNLVATLVEAGLPSGVLNLVLGRGADVGDTLVAAPEVAALSFTGSNVVGRALQLRAVETGKKAQLELGGKNPAVVLRDADLTLAVDQVARGAFLSAGQKCTATSRVIVEDAIFDEFASRLAETARTWKLGDPLEPDTRVGPLASESQLETVCAYLDEGRREGATFLAGGERAASLGEGYFVEPSVVADLPGGSTLLREEIFGPVAALLRVTDFEGAIAAANDTTYGLTASVFTRDLKQALRFSAEVEAGVVKVNQETAGLELHVPFGGTKDSSSGSREQGKVARDFFTEWKTVYIDS